MIISILLLTFFSISTLADTCVPAKEVIEFPHDGSYHRVHPSGNYVMYTGGNTSMVTMVDIRDRAHPKKIETPLWNEAYPVEAADGGWKMISSPYHLDSLNSNRTSMRYYDFADIVAKQQTAEDIYRDDENNQFYQSSVELPGSTKTTKKVRTLLYSRRRYRDYEMKFDSNGRYIKAIPGPTGKTLCDSEPAPLNQTDLADKTELEKQKRAHYDTIRTKQTELEALVAQYASLSATDTAKRAELDQKVAAIKEARSNIWLKIDAIDIKIRKYNYGSRYFELNNKLSEIEKYFTSINKPLPENLSVDTAANIQGTPEELAKVKDWKDFKTEALNIQNKIFAYLANPVQSKDGSYIAGVVEDTVKIIKVNDDGTCKFVVDTGYRGSKVSFAYPVPGKAPTIVFNAEMGASGGYGSSVLTFDADTKKTLVVSTESQRRSEYPGFTKDGRIVYSSSAGFTIVDPNMAPGGSGVCIRSHSTANEGIFEPGANSATQPAN